MTWRDFPHTLPIPVAIFWNILCIIALGSSVKVVERTFKIIQGNSSVHKSQKWKQSKGPLSDEWINQCGIYMQ